MARLHESKIGEICIRLGEALNIILMNGGMTSEFQESVCL